MLHLLFIWQESSKVGYNSKVTLWRLIWHHSYLQSPWMHIDTHTQLDWLSHKCIKGEGGKFLGWKDEYWLLRGIVVYKGSLHTRDCEPVTITLQAFSLVEKAELVQGRYFTLRFRGHRIMWMQDGCEVYMDSYVASNEPCFMITWTISKIYLLEASLTQIRETMALRTLTNVVIFYFYHVWGPQLWWLLHLQRLSYFEHVNQSPLNTCNFFCIRSWSHS